LQAASSPGRDQEIEAKVTNKLQKSKELSGVRASVEDGVVNLAGTVDRYKDKLKAEKDARHAGHVSGVRDLIQVGGAVVPDAELEAKLARKLAYDRIGYGHVFNALTLRVNDGVVMVGGAVINPVDRDSAVSIVQNQAGVKDVVNRIEVLPVSPFDDDIRLRTLRAIYGDPVLSRYGLDPQAPIRIVVDRGHVTLVGAVDNAMDKQIAGIRANQVFGAFSVDNELVARKPVAR
jgi:hyperosmotically inducible periplasmic protein